MPVAYRGRCEDGDLQPGPACASPAFLASSWVFSARFRAANCQAERDGPSWYVSVAAFGVEGRPPAKACDRFRRLLSRKRSLWETMSSAHGTSTVIGRVTVVRCELELEVTVNLPSLFQMSYLGGGMWCGVMGASAVEWFPQTAFSWQKSGFLFAGVADSGRVDACFVCDAAHKKARGQRPGRLYEDIHASWAWRPVCPRGVRLVFGQWGEVASNEHRCHLNRVRRC